MNTRLVEIINTMDDIPIFRKGDIHWLNRNFGTSERHRNHPNFEEAKDLIKKELKK